MPEVHARSPAIHRSSGFAAGTLVPGGGRWSHRGMTSSALHPCASCARHVRADETRCPFCGGEPGPMEVREAARWTGRVTRAAIVLLGASAAGAACSSTSTTPLYGAPVTDAGPGDGAGDDGSAVALYGLPADAGQVRDAADEDAGVQAL